MQCPSEDCAIVHHGRNRDKWHMWKYKFVADSYRLAQTFYGNLVHPCLLFAWFQTARHDISHKRPNYCSPSVSTFTGETDQMLRINMFWPPFRIPERGPSWHPHEPPSSNLVSPYVGSLWPCVLFAQRSFTIGHRPHATYHCQSHEAELSALPGVESSCNY